MELSVATADQVPVQSLIGDRYSRTNLYRIFDELGIRPTKVGRASYITPEQRLLLDQYDLAKSRGAEALQEFLDDVFRDVSEHVGTDSALAQPPLGIAHIEPQAQSQGVWLALEFIANRLSSPKPEPLSLHRQLEDAAHHGWVLTTAQLRAVLGHGPVEGDRYGFRFTKTGRMGRQMGWTIAKTGAE